MNTLQEKLTSIFTKALEENWGLVEDDFKKAAIGYLKQVEMTSPHRIDKSVANAVNLAIDAAVAHHIDTTFARAVDAFAKEKARAQLAARLKRRGMSMNWLDVQPANQATQPELGSETIS